MNDYQQRLLNEMLAKLVEAKMYTNINLLLTILFFIDTTLTLLGYLQFNSLYFMVLVVTFIGNQHMSRKHKTAIKEYEELKEEYENTI
jgi:hypothetical protein